MEILLEEKDLSIYLFIYLFMGGSKTGFLCVDVTVMDMTVLELVL